jgi:pyruvate/2-oxoacid:ferredoxin oxidoreductase alpha subunit
LRPFPTEKVAETLSKFKAVGCVETSTSYGAAMKGGNLIHEVRSALYDEPKRPAITSFMAGLGGEVVTFDEFYNMAKVLAKAAKTGKVDQYVYWVNFDKDV